MPLHDRKALDSNGPGAKLWSWVTPQDHTMHLCDCKALDPDGGSA
jgi:hypothetical protein